MVFSVCSCIVNPAVKADEVCVDCRQLRDSKKDTVDGSC